MFLKPIIAPLEFGLKWVLRHFIKSSNQHHNQNNVKSALIVNASYLKMINHR